jgi:hypothetical protein
MDGWESGLRNAVQGAVRFGTVSVLVFATVAFGEAAMVRGLGLAGAYLLWTVLFLGGGSFWLHPLVPGVSRGYFARWFVMAFLAYALCWCAAWFALPNRYGEWLGAVIGSAGMAWLFRTGGLTNQRWAGLVLAVFIGNTIGYFSGDALHALWGRPWGMVAWGVTFGLGTGAAMGWALGSRATGSLRTLAGNTARIRPSGIE